MKESFAGKSPRARRLTLFSTALIATGIGGFACAEFNDTPATALSYQLYVDPGFQSSHVCDGMNTISCQIFEQTHGANIPATLSSMISAHPQAVWFTDWNTQGAGFIREKVAAKVSAAMAAGKIPQLVSYMIPYRDCSSLSSGGAPHISQWATYIRNFAIGINDGLRTPTPDGRTDLPVIVLLEPDALALMSGDPGCKDRQGNSVIFDNAERMAYIKTAIGTLGNAWCQRGGLTGCPSYLSRVKVYLDAGHAAWKGWPSNLGPMAQRLKDAGIIEAAGFFSNVSNYSPILTATTDEDGTELSSAVPMATRGELEYGKALLADLLTKFGGSWGTWACGSPVGCPIPAKQQIVDTSRNGIVVKWKDNQPNGWPSWCDNQQAHLGDTPTVYTSARYKVDHVAAVLWAKPPGETDGCEGGSATTPPGRLPTDGFPAGMYFLPQACRLMGTDSCEIDINTAPARPRGLRIARITRVDDGAAANTILLEWNPVYGACGYQIARRMSTSGGIGAIAMQAGTWEGSTGPGAPTQFLVVNPRRGAVSQYAVRARNCGEVGRYSAYSSVVTTRDFP